MKYCTKSIFLKSAEPGQGIPVGDQIMKYLAKDTIRRKVKRMAEAIGAPPHACPVYGRGSDFGIPRIAVEEDGYHYIVGERGEELERRITQDIAELLYWIFESITFEMACRYEAEHRVPGKDFRRLLFRWQGTLLSEVSPAFEARRRAEEEAILMEHPFTGEDERGAGNEDASGMAPEQQPRSLRLVQQTATRFLWSDAWLLQAILYASREGPAPLPMVIGAADFINHAILTCEELSGGLARLSLEGLVAVSPAGFGTACSGRALRFLHARENRKYARDLGHDIERWLGTAPYRERREPVQSDLLRYPGLTREVCDAAVAGYRAGIRKR